MSKISVALCTYNGAEFLTAQLESILAQTLPPDELIINDDRSTDETIRIAEQFAPKAPFTVSIEVNDKNLGSTRNFERAINRCSGKIIFLSDQDDVWAPEKIRRTVAEFDADKRVKMVFSNAELVDERLQPLGHNLWDFTFSEEERENARQNDDLFRLLISRNVVTGATMAFDAEFREVFVPIPTDIPNLIHDGWIALVIAARAKVGFIDENLIKYRQHARQQLGIDWRNKQSAGKTTTDENKINKINRQENYDRSIFYSRNEIERLLKIGEVLKKFPQFQPNLLPQSIDETINKFIDEQKQKISHYEARKNLPPGRFRRLSPVLKELRTNRYHRFSKGVFSAAKDLLEKW